MQEFDEAVRKSPYLRPDQEASTDSTATVLGEAEADTNKEGLVLGDGAGSLRLPRWAIILGVVVVFLLLCGILGIMVWCIRQRPYGNETVRVFPLYLHVVTKALPVS